MERGRSVDGGRRARALVGALAAVALSFVPALNVSAAVTVPACNAFKPVSPCVPAVYQTAWFWASNSDITVNTVEDAPVNSFSSKSTSNVQVPLSSGHIGISMKDGDPDMRAYVMFDVGGIPSGADVTSFKFTMTLSLPENHTSRHREFGENGRPPATADPNVAALDVCSVTEPWGTSEGDPPNSVTVDHKPGSDPQTSVQRAEPFTDCSVKGTGERAKDGRSWNFDITALAKRWAGGTLANYGVALLPRTSAINPNWTLEFHGPVTLRDDPTPGEKGKKITYVNKAEALSAKIEFTGGSVPPPFSPTPGPPPLPPTVGSGGIPSFGDDPALGPDVGTAPLPPPTTTGPPLGAGGTPAPKTPGWVWAALPLGVLGLGLVSTALGADEMAAVGAGNRVAMVLRGRRLGIETQTADGGTDA